MRHLFTGREPRAPAAAEVVGAAAVDGESDDASGAAVDTAGVSSVNAAGVDAVAGVLLVFGYSGEIIRSIQSMYMGLLKSSAQPGVLLTSSSTPYRFEAM